MQEAFDEDDFQSNKRQRDTELTLGPMMLLGLFFGLLLLCGLCFGLGYVVGNRGSRGPLTAQQSGVQTASATSAQSKPEAAPPPIRPQPAAPSVSSSDTSNIANNFQTPVSVSADTDGPAQPIVSDSQPAIKQALATPSVAVNQPAPSPPLMVQIAAISHQEDADVLVGALRKRGYSVTINRDPDDRLLHVRIGPFTNRDDVEAMRLKLHNDGYNAIVQP
jgi:cell division septation protein DedD